MSYSETNTHGWTAVVRDQPKFFSTFRTQTAQAIDISAIQVPKSDVARKTQEYAKAQLPEETYNHSMRVFYYGATMIKAHFPTFAPFKETYFLTCLLHDIGTTPTHLTATRLSFEWYGAFLSLDLLKSYSAPTSQAESVCEAITRHQDLGSSGNITSLGQLIQLATIFDNMGLNPELVHKDNIEAVVALYPRKGWSGCFASTIRKEIGNKPWCHTTVIENFAEGVEGNKLMAPYE